MSDTEKNVFRDGQFDTLLEIVDALARTLVLLHPGNPSLDNIAARVWRLRQEILLGEIVR
jgi:hypothetical protein